MYGNDILSKEYDVYTGGVTKNTIAKLSDDDTVTTAAANTDASIGVIETTVASGDAGKKRTRVRLMGIAELKLGGDVTRGAFLTADSSGYGVATTPANTYRYICMALRSGVSGDIIPVLVIPNILPAA